MAQKMSLGRGLIVVMVVCALGLALVGGQTLQTNALEVGLGVIVGLALAVPTALLLVALKGRGGAVEVAGPRPVAAASVRREAQDANAPTGEESGVRVDLGRDLGGIPTGLLVGGNGAAHVLVVRAGRVAEAIYRAAGRAGWGLASVRRMEDLAALVDVCQRRKPQAARLRPMVVAIPELDDVLTGPEAAGAQELHYLLAHGAAAGLHVVAATLHPELAAGAFEVRICGPLSEPEDVALALGVEREVAEDMVQEAGVCWLAGHGNYIGFRPEVG